MTQSQWDRLSRELVDRLVEPEDGDTVILRHGAYYTQCQVADGSAEASAVSNHYLPPESQLTEAQEEKLRTMGWLPPLLPDDRNFHVRQSLPLSIEEGTRFAAMMVGALRDVYGVDSVDQIEADDFNAFGS